MDAVTFGLEIVNMRENEMRYRVAFLLMFGVLISQASSFAEETKPAGWEKIRTIKMSGGLRVFWDVGGFPTMPHRLQAIEHGFEPVNIIGDYADYKGKDKRHIGKFLHKQKVTNNPWNRPDYFEEIVHQNAIRIGGRKHDRLGAKGLFVHDIEFPFEQDIEKAWADPVVRKASGAKNLKEFEEVYLKEWTKWFTIPCDIGKKEFPKLPAGLYGPQPFRRDYWGIVGKSASQIDGTHALDAKLWKHIDPHVDFYIASIYVFYDSPGSVFYIASNVEENFKRTRQYGNKPVYAYSWLRYHNGNLKLKNKELPPWLADATAVIPYFYGAKGNVLWGWEPKLKKGDEIYKHLSVYADSLGRVADLSRKIATAIPAKDDEPAHVLWKEKRPLLKRLKVKGKDEWIVLAVNPWQAEDESSDLKIRCGSRRFTLKLQGRHSDIFHIKGRKVKRLQVNYEGKK